MNVCLTRERDCGASLQTDGNGLLRCFWSKCATFCGTWRLASLSSVFVPRETQTQDLKNRTREASPHRRPHHREIPKVL